ncbi:MAG: response regulator [Dictyoglomaceae bacterium]
MYKVIIIDDEPLIRKGLRKIIDWNNFGFNIIGDAENGIDGYKKICSLNPDLCIIDIKMPGMDGLSLIEKIKNKNINTKIIILTGYPEFEYAKKAIDLGVETYLLKPIDPEILAEKIKKIYLELEREKSIKKLINKSIEFTKEKIIEKLIKRELEGISIEELEKMYNINFTWKAYQVILIEPNNEEIFREIKNIFSYYAFPIDNLIGILVEDISKPHLKKKIIDIKNKIKSKYLLDIYISVGEKVFNIQEVYKSYNSALTLFKKKFLYNKKGIILYQGDRKTKTVEEISDENIVQELIRFIEKLDINNINDILDRKMKFCISEELKEEEIKTSYLKIFLNIINHFSTNYSKFKEISKNYLTDTLIKEFYKKESLFELNCFMKSLILDITENFSKIFGRSIISKILEYLECNYYKDLKIKEVAKIFGYNSCYFGKIFRRYTGENFNTYLDKIRINKAKELLLQGIKVVEVAEKVGYKDIDYFIMKFKKYTGKSPKNYKEELINSS